MSRPKPWRDAKKEQPPTYTPVLACVEGLATLIVLEVRWQKCNTFEEPYYADYKYWDDPHNDGQDYGDKVLWWRVLPELPEK